MTTTMTPRAIRRLIDPGKCQLVEVKIRISRHGVAKMQVNKAQVRRMLQDHCGPKAQIDVTVLDAETGGRHLEVVRGKVDEPYRLVIGQ